jgi:hypothetical protein
MVSSEITRTGLAEEVKSPCRSVQIFWISGFGMLVKRYRVGGA